MNKGGCVATFRYNTDKLISVQTQIQRTNKEV